MIPYVLLFYNVENSKNKENPSYNLSLYSMLYLVSANLNLYTFPYPQEGGLSFSFFFTLCIN